MKPTVRTQIEMIYLSCIVLVETLNPPGLFTSIIRSMIRDHLVQQLSQVVKSRLPLSPGPTTLLAVSWILGLACHGPRMATVSPQQQRGISSLQLLSHSTNTCTAPATSTLLVALPQSGSREFQSLWFFSFKLPSKWILQRKQHFTE